MSQSSWVTLRKHSLLSELIFLYHHSSRRRLRGSFMCQINKGTGKTTRIWPSPDPFFFTASANEWLHTLESHRFSLVCARAWLVTLCPSKKFTKAKEKKKGGVARTNMLRLIRLMLTALRWHAALEKRACRAQSEPGVDVIEGFWVCP